LRSFLVSLLFSYITLISDYYNKTRYRSLPVCYIFFSCIFLFFLSFHSCRIICFILICSLPFYCTTLAKRNHATMYMYELASNRTNTREREQKTTPPQSKLTNVIKSSYFSFFFFNIVSICQHILPCLKSIGQACAAQMRLLLLYSIPLVSEIKYCTLFNFTSRFASSTVMSNNCC